MQQKITAYQCETSVGIFRIELQDDGLFHAVHNERNFGGYVSPESALRDLVSGDLYLPYSGVSPAMIGVPDRLREWGVVLCEDL